MELSPAALAAAGLILGALIGWVAAALNASERHTLDRAAREDLLEAIRLTQEYAQLPAIDGWSWWDAYRRHRPKDARRLRRDWLRHQGGRDEWNDSGDYAGVRTPDGVLHTDVPAPLPAPSDEDLVPVADPSGPFPPDYPDDLEPGWDPNDPNDPYR